MDFKWKYHFIGFYIYILKPIQNLKQMFETQFECWRTLPLPYLFQCPLLRSRRDWNRLDSPLPWKDPNKTRTSFVICQTGRKTRSRQTKPLIRPSNKFIFFQNKFDLILQILYTESVYILICCLQFKSSSNWWKFEDIWGKFTKIMLFFVQKRSSL